MCGELQTDEDQAKEEGRLNEQFEALGVVPDSPVIDPLEPFYLWPEHVEAYELFASLRTQWRSDFAGPTGLDYGAVIAHMRAIRIRGPKFDELYEAVRVMEQGGIQGFVQQRVRNGS